MRTEKRVIGDLGEGIACLYLKGQGYSILERNYLKKWGEIDIVAQKEKDIHFVEVKTLQRHNLTHFDSGNFRAEDNVHERKVQRLWRTLESYLLENNVSEKVSWQIDVCTVYLDILERKAKVNLIENIII